MAAEKKQQDDLERYVNWAIGKFFPNPPYILRAGECVLADDNNAIWEILTLSAAICGPREDEDVRSWLLDRVRELRDGARTGEEFIQDTDYSDAFKTYAIRRIYSPNFEVELELCADPSSAGDYRFSVWLACEHENWVADGGDQ